jgi:hypothetical protein
VNGYDRAEPELCTEPVVLECPRCGVKRYADPADLRDEDEDAVCVYCTRDEQAKRRKSA